MPAGAGHLDVELPCVNLVPGRYSLSLWVSDGPYMSHVYDAINITVPRSRTFTPPGDY